MCFAAFPVGAAGLGCALHIVDRRLPHRASLPEDVVGLRAALRRRRAVVHGSRPGRARDLPDVLGEAVLVRVGLGPVGEVGAALTEGVQVRHAGAEAETDVVPAAVLERKDHHGRVVLRAWPAVSAHAGSATVLVGGRTRGDAGRIVGALDARVTGPDEHAARQMSPGTTARKIRDDIRLVPSLLVVGCVAMCQRNHPEELSTTSWSPVTLASVYGDQPGRGEGARWG